MDISTFLEGLTVLQKIYWTIAVSSTLIFLVQLIMLLVGGDVDDLDYDSSFAGDGADLDIFSLKSIVAFLMFFGWSGLAAYDVMPVWGAIIISIAAGLTMMFVTAWVFILLLRLQSSGTLKVENAIGQTGDVYITIPGNEKGNGKVQIIIQGTLRTMDAITDETDDIKTGSYIEVIDFINDTLIVRRKI